MQTTPPASMEKQQKHILVGVTGGIAAYKSAILVRRLIDAGFSVRVMMSRGAQAFITPLTFQALSGHPVHTELLDPTAEAGMGHIDLARWADLVLIAPTSANTLAKITYGLADELLPTVVLACTCPVWLAPAMNKHMWQNAATVHNVSVLKQRGVKVIEPEQGEQACGDVGAGRLPEPETLAALVSQYFEEDHAIAHLLRGKRIVITAGPTREAIDPVRYLSNHSTGKMGFALAERCAAHGADVTLISGPVALSTPLGVKRISVQSAVDMLAAADTCVNAGCDIFIGTAAVADYRAAHIASHKIKKSEDDLHIHLTKNPDVLGTIAQHKKRPFMVGFAAETQHMETYAQGKLTSKQLDMIACNDVSRQDIGFGSDDNAMTVFFAEKHGLAKRVLDKASKKAIADQLIYCFIEATAIDKT